MDLSRTEHENTLEDFAEITQVECVVSLGRSGQELLKNRVVHSQSGPQDGVKERGLSTRLHQPETQYGSEYTPLEQFTGLDLSSMLEKV